MGEEKFASLTSGLLARKGAAKPAMRRQGYMNPNGDVADDLGWNDMGYEPPRPVDEHDHDRINGEAPQVRRQLDELAEHLNGETTSYAGPAHAGLSPMKGSNPLERDEPLELDEPVDDENVESVDAESDSSEEAYADEAYDQTYEDEPEVYVPELSEQAIAKIIPMPRVEDNRPAPEEDHVPARDKVAFTLRLDKERHLKLRLASAIENRSAQQLVTAAIDDFFKAMPDLERLAANAQDRN